VVWVLVLVASASASQLIGRHVKKGPGE